MKEIECDGMIVSLHADTILHIELKKNKLKYLKKICFELLKKPSCFNMRWDYNDAMECGCLGHYAEKAKILDCLVSWEFSLMKSVVIKDHFLWAYLFSGEWGYNEDPKDQLLDCIGRIDALLEGGVEGYECS